MKISIDKVKPNPDNPRIIKDDAFKKLVRSIKEFPEMAEAREIVVNEDYVILGGNMRFRAMQEAGWTEVPIKIVDWPEDKQKEFIIKDNVSGGEWDWDLLANEWELEDLEEWDLKMPVFNVSEQQKTTDEDVYDFENFDNTGFTTIKIVLPDEQAQNLIAKISEKKGELNLSEYIYEHFCN